MLQLLYSYRLDDLLINQTGKMENTASIQSFMVAHGPYIISLCYFVINAHMLVNVNISESNLTLY